MVRLSTVGVVTFGLLLGLVSVAPGQSGLLGDTYRFSGLNFPDSFGTTIDTETQLATDHGSPPVTLTFDGIAQVAGGMSVNERVVVWDGKPGGIFAFHALGVDGQTDWDLIAWEEPGEVVEFTFQTLDGGYLSAEDDLGQSGLTVEGLDWFNAEPEWTPQYFEDGGFYFYFSVDGVAVTGYESQTNDALLVGEHPFDESVEEVVFIGYSSGQVEDITEPYPGGMDLTFGTSQLEETIGSWDLLASFALGLDEFAAVDGKPANGFHVGFLMTAPEEAFAPNALQAGDADQNLEFDQFDLIKVQQAAKYLTDQAATWGEGDWDGAPGGTQGNPPSGDGLFNQLDIIEALAAGTYLTGPYAALGAHGGRGDEPTSQIYDANTGGPSVDALDGLELIHVPEPSALVLACLGMVALVMGKTRRFGHR